MTFGNLLTVIFFGYLFYYAGMISYDQFFKKEAIPLEATVDVIIALDDENVLMAGENVVYTEIPVVYIFAPDVPVKRIRPVLGDNVACTVNEPLL